MKQENEYSFLGCAGNVGKIINEFNCNVFLLTCIGKNNKIIKNICLNEKINIDYSFFLENYNQTKKRYINNNQQYFRVDNYDIFDFNKYKFKIQKNF